MIEAVVFDVGGVVTACPLTAFSSVDEEYGLPADTLVSFIRGGDFWIGVETGRVPVAEFYRHCAEQLAADHAVEVPEARLHRMLEDCMGTTTQAETMDLVHELDDAGYELALCTNIFAERREWLHGLFAEGVIDVYCDSSEVGLRKPEPAIYHKLLEMLGRPAGEVAFVDDFEENVAAARELGMAAIRFESPTHARRELAELGVRVESRDRGASPRW